VNTVIVGASRGNPAADTDAELQPPSFLARRARFEWDSLRLRASQPTERYEPDVAAGLPTAVRRWLTHAIPAGTPLFSCVRLTMSGEIKLGSWQAFHAEQLLVPGQGYLWAATTHLHRLRITGYDRYSHGSGEMDWRVLGAVPVNRIRGDDVTRSAAGRLVGEVALLPTAFRAVTWSATQGDTASATATMTRPDRPEQARLMIDPSGAVTGVRMTRWGQPAGLPWGDHGFGVSVEAESRFDGIAIPSTIRAGWWMGTEREAEGEFLRARITAAAFASGGPYRALPIGQLQRAIASREGI
jgi:hypothetical protein